MRGWWQGDVFGLVCWASVMACAANDRAESSAAADATNEAVTGPSAAPGTPSAGADGAATPAPVAPAAPVDRGASASARGAESVNGRVGAIGAAADAADAPSAADAGAVAIESPPTETEPEPEAEREPTAEPEPVRALSFEADIHPLLAMRCGPCHTTRGTTGHNVGGALPGAYRDALKLGQLLLDRVDGGGMPPACDGNPGAPGCFSVAEVELVRSWLAQGSPR